MLASFDVINRFPLPQVSSLIEFANAKFKCVYGINYKKNHLYERACDLLNTDSLFLRLNNSRRGQRLPRKNIVL